MLLPLLLLVRWVLLVQLLLMMGGDISATDLNDPAGYLFDIFNPSRHPFVATKRARVTASEVVQLQKLVWDGSSGGATSDMPTIHEVFQHSLCGAVRSFLR